MPKDRRSFFERLTGSVPAGEYYSNEEESVEEEPESPRAHLAASQTKTRPQRQAQTPVKKEDEWLNVEEEGQLTVDVFQTDSEIVIQSTVAGVRPDDLDVQITRDMVTIRGKREQMREVTKNDYFYQELYWGSFSRSILLPSEVDVDESEATLKNGLLTVKLPKLDRNRSERLKVKNE